MRAHVSQSVSHLRPDLWPHRIKKAYTCLHCGSPLPIYIDVMLHACFSFIFSEVYLTCVLCTEFVLFLMRFDGKQRLIIRAACEWTRLGELEPQWSRFSRKTSTQPSLGPYTTLSTNRTHIFRENRGAEWLKWYGFLTMSLWANLHAKHYGDTADFTIGLLSTAAAETFYESCHNKFRKSWLRACRSYSK